MFSWQYCILNSQITKYCSLKHISIFADYKLLPTFLLDCLRCRFDPLPRDGDAFLQETLQVLSKLSTFTPKPNIRWTKTLLINSSQRPENNTSIYNALRRHQAASKTSSRGIQNHRYQFIYRSNRDEDHEANEIAVSSYLWRPRGGGKMAFVSSQQPAAYIQYGVSLGS